MRIAAIQSQLFSIDTHGHVHAPVCMQAYVQTNNVLIHAAYMYAYYKYVDKCLQQHDASKYA